MLILVIVFPIVFSYTKAKKKVVLSPEIGWVKFFSSLTRIQEKQKTKEDKKQNKLKNL